MGTRQDQAGQGQQDEAEGDVGKPREEIARCPLCGYVSKYALTMHFWDRHYGFLPLSRDEVDPDRCLCGHNLGNNTAWGQTDAALLTHIATCDAFWDAVALYRLSGGLMK